MLMQWLVILSPEDFPNKVQYQSATVLLTQAKIDDVNVFTLIDIPKGIDDVKLSAYHNRNFKCKPSKNLIIRYKDNTVSQSNRKKKHSEVTWLNLHRVDFP